MPIADLTYDELQKLSRTHLCGVCHSNVTVAWIDNRYVLRCANDLSHGTIANKPRIPDYLSKEIEKSMSTQIAKFDRVQMEARVNHAKFPQELKPQEKVVLVRAALDYRLDPLMGELTIFQGKPFVSIDGRLRKAHESGQFEGIESRPATEDERKARGTPEGNKLWRSEVFKVGCSHGFVGWGEVKAGEMKGNEHLPTVAWPDRMAEKRSQVMALRLAFYLPLPSIEEPEEIATPTVKVAVEANPSETIEQRPIFQDEDFK
jgi:hypothetical protein